MRIALAVVLVASASIAADLPLVSVSNGYREVLPGGVVRITPYAHVDTKALADVLIQPPNGSTVTLTATVEIRPVSGTYSLPMHLTAHIGGYVQRSATYLAGDVIFAESSLAAWNRGYPLFRATQGGVTATASPSFEGPTIRDGSVTWQNAGSTIGGLAEFALPVATATAAFQVYAVTVTVPPHSNPLPVEFGLVWGNNSVPVPLEIASADVREFVVNGQRLQLENFPRCCNWASNPFTRP